MMFDEGGNCYLSNAFIWNNILCDIGRTFFLDFTTWSFLTADQYQKLLTPEIIVDEEVREFKSFARRPYYRMRKKLPWIRLLISSGGWTMFFDSVLAQFGNMPIISEV